MLLFVVLIADFIIRTWKLAQVTIAKNENVPLGHVYYIQICRIKQKSITRQATYCEMFVKMNSFTPCPNRCDTMWYNSGDNQYVCSHQMRQVQNATKSITNHSQITVHDIKSIVPNIESTVACCVSSSRLARKIAPLLLTRCAATRKEHIFFMLIHVFYVKGVIRCPFSTSWYDSLGS